MPPQTEGMISSRDLAGKLKERYPQLSKYSDDSIVDAFLAKNPKFRPRIQFEAKEAPLGAEATAIAPRGFREKAREAVAGGKAALPAIGATAAVAMTPETGGLAGILLPLLAAWGGGATGKGTEQLVGKLLGQEQPGLKERLGEMGTAGLEQLFAEMGGRTMERPLAKVFGQGSKVLTHPEDIAVKEISDKYGLRLTPSEIEKRGVQESLQKSAETSILGRSTMQTAKQRTFTAAERATDDALRQLSAPTSALAAGQNLQTALKDSNEIFHQYGRRLYEDVDREGAGVLVNMQPLKDWAQGVLAGPAGQAAAQWPKMAKFTAAEQAILKDAASSAQLVPFSVAHELRKRLLSIGPEMTEMMPTVGKGMAKKAAGMVTDLMEKAGAGLQGKRAVDAWNAARSFWRDGGEIFSDGLIQKLVDQQPSLVVRALKTPEDVNMVKTALERYNVKFGTHAQRVQATDAWNQVRERYVRDVLLEAPAASLVTRVGGQVKSEPMLNLAENLRTTPPETLQALFSDPKGKQTYEVLREIGQAMERVSPMSPAPELSIWKLFRFGAGVEEYEWILSKALAHPKHARKVLYAIRQIPRSLDTAVRVMQGVSEEVQREEGQKPGEPQ